MQYGEFRTQVQLRCSPDYAYSTIRDLVRYGVRCLFGALVLETILQYMFVFTFWKYGLFDHTSRASQYWLDPEPRTPVQLGALVYFTLNVIYLKYLTIWRFFRLWSMLSGVTPPENMPRCVNNHLSIKGFWRYWHHSFH